MTIIYNYDIKPINSVELMCAINHVINFIVLKYKF